jgi:hypothetical protein
MRPRTGTQRTSGSVPALRGLERRQYLDDIVDDYVSWREACAMVASAYSNWQRAGRQAQKLAFSEYVAALNCEEEAAKAYQQAVERGAAMHAHAQR